MIRVSAQSAARRGMTLVEVLTAISIIVILAALVIGAGTAVFGKQRAKQTEGVLVTLDRMLEEYIIEVGTIPPYDPDQFDRVPGSGNRIERYAGGRHARFPDASVFIWQVRGVGASDEIIGSMQTEFLVLTPEGSDGSDDIKAQQPSVVDSWAEPGWSDRCPQNDPWCVEQQQLVFYVHPDNNLAQALYGRCINSRPYFVSAGPDQFYGLPGEIPEIESAYELGPESGEGGDAYTQRVLRTARADNIYSYSIDTNFVVPDSLLP